MFFSASIPPYSTRAKRHQPSRDLLRTACSSHYNALQMLTVRRLVWDEWNVEHIARHEVTPDEVEQVCQGEPMTSETYSDRLRVVGPTDASRMLTVILAPEGKGVYYPVMGRPASRKERRLYEDSKEGQDNATAEHKSEEADS